MPAESFGDSLYYNSGPGEINSALPRAFMLLRSGDFAHADELCDYVLHIYPGSGLAYLGKLMAELRLRIPEDLLTTDKPYVRLDNYRFALTYSDPRTREFLQTAPYENFYLRAKENMADETDEQALRTAAGMFEQISEYKDSAAMKERCLQMAEKAVLEGRYREAERMMAFAADVGAFIAAANAFSSLDDYRDARK